MQPLLRQMQLLRQLILVADQEHQYQFILIDLLQMVEQQHSL
jgi:hypothetical protein